MEHQPKILWDKGSAYDLFTSLYILHRPDEYGLRPSWAAGVRSRLPIQLRDALERSQRVIFVPLAWLHALPEPKDAATVMDALKALSPEERLPALVFADKDDQRSRQYKDFLLSLNGKQRMTARIEGQIKSFHSNPANLTKDYLRTTFEAWSERGRFGVDLVLALEAYISNFFEEEQIRIIPAQGQALENAQSLFHENDLLTALETLSIGVRMDWVNEVSTLVLAPSFWGAPFVFFDKLDEETGIILFGARPEGTALIPGELVPDELLNALKAIADPTRLRILYYLRENGPSTPSQLATILRLRPPTVIHHLQNLRLAGLVGVTVSPKAERRYALRMSGVDTTIHHLRAFLSGE
jgi:DNA-binding transcriptional ArsR family regulator